MKCSLERVRAVVQGRMPDRAPMFDLLRNDAVIAHFTGQTLTVENGAELVYRAYAPAIDATRPWIRLPQHEKTIMRPDGREQRQDRWTIWTAHRHFADTADYESEMRRRIGSFDPAWTQDKQSTMDKWVANQAAEKSRLGEVFFFTGAKGLCLTNLFDEVGLEDFSYYLADCPDVIGEMLEVNALEEIQWYKHLPEGHGIEAVFLADDIAFKSGPLFNPVWMRKHYFHRLARVLAAIHEAGIKILFHSDGNLNPILDDLVEAGIDGLNPIEILAGMNVGDIHRRYPKLFMAGGIDVSQLLPFGTPQQVKDAVRNAIEDAEGRLMVGSSTELNDAVPLENFLALREAVLES